MAASPYPIAPDLTAISVLYKNPDYIADMVLPRTPVGKQSFSYITYPVDTMFNIYDTTVSRRGKTNEIVMEGVEVNDATLDQGLEAAIPQVDIDNSDKRYNPRDQQTMQLSQSVSMGREQRVANLVFNTASYGSGLTTTLSGASQYSDYINSDPVVGINAMLDLPLMRPNKLIFGQATWTVVRSHPKIVQACKGTAQVGGIVSRQAVADVFEVGEVLVGASRTNANRPGQTPLLSRLWGKHIAGIYIPPVLTGQGEVAFGATFEFEQRRVQEWQDQDIGMRGGQRIRVGESLRERIIANQAGFFIQNATA